MPSNHNGWGWSAVAAVMLAGIAVASTAAQQTPPAAPELQAASDDIQSFVRMALEDRLAAHNVPDINVLGDGTRIAIRAEMPEARRRLTDRALPHQPGYDFTLITTAAAQAIADRTRKSMPFVAIDLPKITDSDASVWIGVETADPVNPKMVKLCCCAGVANFRRVGERWTFVKWGMERCS